MAKAGPSRAGPIEDASDDVRRSLTLDAQRIEGRLGKELADIFRAQEAILLDPSVVEELKRTLEVEKINLSRRRSVSAVST